MKVVSNSEFTVFSDFTNGDSPETLLIYEGTAEMTSTEAFLGDAAEAVVSELEVWRAEDRVHRLWSRDQTLWSGQSESDWLGWLEVIEAQRDMNQALKNIILDVRQAGFRSVVLVGMGGAVLSAEVISQAFSPIGGFPNLFVFDSIDPFQIRALEKKIDLSATLFVVSSKSGKTIESKALSGYFFEKVRRVVGEALAGSHFIAITDPGTELDKVSKGNQFRHTLYGVPSIGGRYSALSNFGLVPSAIMGLDVPDFLNRAEIMIKSCSAMVAPELNPGVRLGVILGVLASTGRDKVTFVISPSMEAFGGWLEQLIAESTGKRGVGLIPVNGEELARPEVYGRDRFFVYLRLAEVSDESKHAALVRLENAGHPVVRITIEDRMDLGQEFFRWEIATAVAASILGINPFDQPDVEAGKLVAQKLSDSYEKTGLMDEEVPTWQFDGIGFFTDTANTKVVAGATCSPRTMDGLIAAHLSRIKVGDYFGLNAHIGLNAENNFELQRIRHLIRDRKCVPTTIGIGPRFLHSTGQLHKGGPNSGVFLQLTSESSDDLKIPGQQYTFGALRRFQAQGDLEILQSLNRRVMRVHLGSDVLDGLVRLRKAVEVALS